jgi:hypothetical protein
MVYNHKLRRVMPVAVRWAGGVKKITAVDLHHTYRVGRTLFHVFSVTTQGAVLILVLNTDSLFWEVEEVAYDAV